jgi:hypothetical protein
MKTCLFTNTPDSLRHRHVGGNARVCAAAGFGARFQVLQRVGEILADLALEGGTRHDISLFPETAHGSFLLATDQRLSLTAAAAQRHWL